MRPLRRFIHYYAPYKALFVLDIFCAILASAIDLVFPQLLNQLTGGLFTQGTEKILSVLGTIALGLLGMYLVRTLCQFFITSYGHYMGAWMERDMRKDLFDHYTRMSFSYFDQNNTGEMMSRLITDLFDISELAHHGPENLIICTLKIIGSFVMLMLINVRMSLILMGVTVIMVVYSVARQKKMQAVSMDNRKKIATVTSGIQDSLAGIRVVQTFANEQLERDKFAVANGAYKDSKERYYLFMGLFHSGNSFFQGLLYLTVLVSGGWFIAQGSLEVTELAIFALYISIFLSPIETLINFTETLQKGFTGFIRFCEILDTQPDVQERPKALELKDVKGDIVYENVSFEYEEGVKVLDKVNLHVKPGRTIALVGPSGGGKTTICSLLPRFYDVTSGRITLDGTDIREYTLKSLRQAIGIVQQDVYMFAGTIRENIAYGDPDATQEQIIQAAKDAGIHDFVMSLEKGYDTYVGERGTRLSGGQKQRIAIARVFLKNPPVLILDEATSALDNESERYIQASLERLSHDRTTIVIAHRLSTIRMADEIIVIGDDGIRERGTHDELLKLGGLYSRYWRMQFESIEELDAMLEK